jgi:hypothetical protein
MIIHIHQMVIDMVMIMVDHQLQNGVINHLLLDQIIILPAFKAQKV